ncbi:unnamed protein product [Adineta ricciae]|uniref:Uncharacterized protein n=1 Tax=Adineta ricciae TaxID=249248 RepID=A0A814PUX7_ADIRI|nr:unnamed protein product [Adineta ricciae]CAF1147045.1 unnamed protein product [Adineta ricciae]
MLSASPPNNPWSDVTSSLKATSSGEVCKLPFQVGAYTWDLYFCYRRHCPTLFNKNSTCAEGKFAGIQLNQGDKASYQLKTESNGIDGINEQTLVYYYYMSYMIGKSIHVRKVEIGGASSVIDTVTNSPFNGWIRREVRYHAAHRGYEIHFDVEKTSSDSSFNDIGLDEISISEEDETTTHSPTTTTETSTVTSASTTVEDSTTTDLLTTSLSFAYISNSSMMTTEQATSITNIFEKSTTALIPTTIDITTSKTQSSTVSIRTTTTSSVSAMSTTKNVETTNLATITSYTSSSMIITNSSKTTHSIITLTSDSTLSVINSTNLTISDDKNDVKPSSNTYIIVLSTVIPVVCIISIGIIIKFNRSLSYNSFKRKLRLLKNRKHSKSSSDDFEMNFVYDEYWF